MLMNACSVTDNKINYEKCDKKGKNSFSQYFVREIV